MKKRKKKHQSSELLDNEIAAAGIGYGYEKRMKKQRVELRADRGTYTLELKQN